MATFEGAVEFNGNPVTLEGGHVEKGKRAPNFRVKPNISTSVEFEQSRGNKVIILTSAMSVDTQVCADQLSAFDRRATELNDADIDIWYITRDLPFALDRAVEERNIQKVNVFSDYQFREFGDNYGLTIRDFDLLARSAMVVDKNGNVVYKEVVSEATDEPDYNAAINAARTASQTQ